MSKVFEFEQTSIPSQLSINLMENHGMIWVDSRSRDMYRVLFTSICDVLKYKQDKNTPRVGFIMKDDKGNFKFGAVLNFRKPDEEAEEDTGSWYLEFTFYPEDMTDLDVELDNHSDVFAQCAILETYNIASGKFSSNEDMNKLFITMLDTLVNYLDANASDDDEVEVTLRGVFTMSVGVENGKKVMSIVPGEAIKQVIKADSIL